MMKINMQQFRSPEVQANVDENNYRFYDMIEKRKGVIVSLDYRPYVEFCCENNIFYTFDDSE